MGVSSSARRTRRVDAASRWCSFPVLPNACSRSDCARTRCLLDDRRRELAAPLATQKQRADDERLQLRLAVGAASANVSTCPGPVSSCRSRGRECRLFTCSTSRERSKDISPPTRRFAIGPSRLAAPRSRGRRRPIRTNAIDEFEHDLSMLYQLLRETDRRAAKGRARYLYELSPHLQRSLTGRWARWQNRWHPVRRPDSHARRQPLRRSTAIGSARGRSRCRRYSDSPNARISFICPRSTSSRRSKSRRRCSGSTR